MYHERVRCEGEENMCHERVYYERMSYQSCSAEVFENS